MKPQYLTESLLSEKLSFLFPTHTVIRNKKIQNSNSNGRPDFYYPELSLVVEFDGYLHYSSADTIIRDIEKDKCYSSIGIKIVRIPYFIQWCPKLIQNKFGIESDVDQEYPHGFIDDKAMLPANFCELGIAKFLSDLSIFDFAQDDIIRSLLTKIEQHKNPLKVIPPSMHSLLKIV